MFLGVRLSRFHGLITRMSLMTTRRMSMMRGLFVLSCFVVFRCFAMMAGRLRVMFRGSLVML